MAQRYTVAGFGTTEVNQTYERNGDSGQYPKYVSADGKYRIIRYGAVRWVIQLASSPFSIFYGDILQQGDRDLEDANWATRRDTDIGIDPIGTVTASVDDGTVDSQDDPSQPADTEDAITSTSSSFLSPDKYLAKDFDNASFNGTYVENILRDFQTQRTGEEYSGSSATIIEPKIIFSGVSEFGGSGRWVMLDSKTNETYYLDSQNPSDPGIKVDDVSWIDVDDVPSDGTIKEILNVGEKLESQFYDNFAYSKNEIVEDTLLKYYSFGTGVVNYADPYGGSIIYETDLLGNYKQIINNVSAAPSTGRFICASGKVYYGTKKTALHMNKDHSTLVPFSASGTKFGFAISGDVANKARKIKFVSLHDQDHDKINGEVVQNYIKIYASGRSALTASSRGFSNESAWDNDYAYQYTDLDYGETGVFTGGLNFFDGYPSIGEGVGYFAIFSRFPILCSVESLNEPGEHSMQLMPGENDIFLRNSPNSVQASDINKTLDDELLFSNYYNGGGDLQKGVYLETYSGVGISGTTDITGYNYAGVTPKYTKEYLSTQSILTDYLGQTITISGVTDDAGNIISGLTGFEDNYLFYSEHRSPTDEIFETEINTGNGKSTVGHVPLSRLSNTFAYGGHLRDFTIVAPFRGTNIEVLYYSGDKYHELYNFTNQGALDAPIYNRHSNTFSDGSFQNTIDIYRDGDGAVFPGSNADIGDSVGFLNNTVGPWLIRSDNPIAVWYNDESGYVNILNGWRSNIFTPTYGSKISFQCENAKWNGGDYSTEIMPQGLNSIKATLDLKFVGDKNYTKNLIAALQKKINNPKYGDLSYSGGQNYLNFNDEYDGSNFFLETGYYSNFSGSIIENLNIKNVSNEVYETTVSLYNDRVSSFTKDGMGFVNDAYVKGTGNLAANESKEFLIVSGDTGDLNSDKFNSYFYLTRDIGDFETSLDPDQYSSVTEFKVNGMGYGGGSGQVFTQWDGKNPLTEAGKFFHDRSGSFDLMPDGTTGTHIPITGTVGSPYLNRGYGFVIQETGNTNWGDVLLDDDGNSGVQYFRSGVEISYNEVTEGDTYFTTERVYGGAQPASLGNGVVRAVQILSQNPVSGLDESPGIYGGAQMWIGSGMSSPDATNGRLWPSGFKILFRQNTVDRWVSNEFESGLLLSRGTRSDTYYNANNSPEQNSMLLPINNPYRSALDSIPGSFHYPFVSNLYNGYVQPDEVPYDFVLGGGQIVTNSEAALISDAEGDELNYTLTSTFTGISENGYTRTFFFKPDRQVEINYDYSNGVNKFKNSISQYINIGDNKNSIKGLNLTFNNRTEQETRAILHFLETHMGYKPFVYLHDDKLIQNKKVYICESWDHTFNYKDSNTINVNIFEMAFAINPFEPKAEQRFASYGVPGAAEILSAINFEDFKFFGEDADFKGVVDNNGDLDENGVTPPGGGGSDDPDDNNTIVVRGNTATFQTNSFQPKPFEIFRMQLTDAGDNGVNDFVSNVQIGGTIVNPDLKTSGRAGSVLPAGTNFDYVIKPNDTGYNVRHFVRYNENANIGGRLIQFASRDDFTISGFEILTGNENGTGLNGVLESSLTKIIPLANPGVTQVGPNNNQLYFEPDSELIDLMGSGAYFLSEIFEHRQGPTPKSNNIILDYDDNDEQFKIIVGYIWQRYNNVTLSWDTVNDTVGVREPGLSVSGEPGNPSEPDAVQVYSAGGNIQDFRKETYTLDDVANDFGTSYRLVHVYMDILSGDALTNYQLDGVEGIKKVNAYANTDLAGDYSLNDQITDTGFYLYTGVTEEFDVGYTDFGKASFEIRKHPNHTEVIKQFAIAADDVFQAYRTVDDPNGNPAGTYPANHTFVWELDGRVLAGETDFTYTVKTDDLGKSLRCTISYTDPHGFSNTIKTDPVTLGRQGDAFRMLIDTDLEVIEYASVKYVNDINLSPSWDGDLNTKPLEYKSDPKLNQHSTRFKLLFEPNTLKNITIEWGDGTSDIINEITEDYAVITDYIDHDYAEHGVYEISIRGDLPLTYGRQHDWLYEGKSTLIGLADGESVADPFDKYEVYGGIADNYVSYQQKIIEITNFSQAHTLTHPSGMFAGAIRLVKSSSPQDMRFAADVISTESMFEDCFCLQEIDGLQLSGIQDITEMFYNCMSLNNIDFYLSGVKSITNSFVNLGQAINPMGTFDHFWSSSYGTRVRWVYPNEPLNIKWYDIGDVETGRRYADGDNLVTGRQALKGGPTKITGPDGDYDIDFTNNQDKANIYHFLSNPANDFYSKSRGTNSTINAWNEEENYQILTNEGLHSLITGISGAIANGKSFWTGATPGHDDTTPPDFFLGYDAGWPMPWNIKYLHYLNDNGFDIASYQFSVTDYPANTLPFTNNYLEPAFNAFEVLLTGSQEQLDSVSHLKFEIFPSEEDRTNGTNKQEGFLIGLEQDGRFDETRKLKRFLGTLEALEADDITIRGFPVVSGDIPNTPEDETFSNDNLQNSPNDLNYFKYTNNKNYEYFASDGIFQQDFADKRNLVSAGELQNLLRKLTPNVKNNFIKVTAGTWTSESGFVQAPNIQLENPVDNVNNGFFVNDELKRPGDVEKFIATRLVKADRLSTQGSDVEPFEYLRGSDIATNPDNFKVISDIQPSGSFYYQKIGDTYEAKRIIKYSFECISEKLGGFYNYYDSFQDVNSHFGGKVKYQSEEILFGRSKSYGLWDPAVFEIDKHFHQNNPERMIDPAKKQGYFSDTPSLVEYRYQTITMHFGDIEIRDDENNRSIETLGSLDGGLMGPGLSTHMQMQAGKTILDGGGEEGIFYAREPDPEKEQWIHRYDGFRSYNIDSKFRQIHGFGYVNQPEIKLKSTDKVISRGHLMDLSIQPEMLTQKGTLFNQQWFDRKLKNSQLTTELSQHLTYTAPGAISYIANHNYAKISNPVSTHRENWAGEYQYNRSEVFDSAAGTDLKAFRGINEIKMINGVPTLVPGINAYIGNKGEDRFRKDYYIDSYNSDYLDYTEDSFIKNLYDEISGQHIYTIPQLRGRVFNDYYVTETIEVDALLVDETSDDTKRESLYGRFSDPLTEDDFEFPVPDYAPSQFYEKDERSIKSDGKTVTNFSTLVRDYNKLGKSASLKLVTPETSIFTTKRGGYETWKDRTLFSKQYKTNFTPAGTDIGIGYRTDPRGRLTMLLGCSTTEAEDVTYADDNTSKVWYRFGLRTSDYEFVDVSALDLDQRKELFESEGGFKDTNGLQLYSMRYYNDEAAADDSADVRTYGFRAFGHISVLQYQFESPSVEESFWFQEKTGGFTSPTDPNPNFYADKFPSTNDDPDFYENFWQIWPYVNNGVTHTSGLALAYSPGSGVAEKEVDYFQFRTSKTMLNKSCVMTIDAFGTNSTPNDLDGTSQVRWAEIVCSNSQSQAYDISYKNSAVHSKTEAIPILKLHRGKRMHVVDSVIGSVTINGVTYDQYMDDPNTFEDL